MSSSIRNLTIFLFWDVFYTIYSRTKCWICKKGKTLRYIWPVFPLTCHRGERSFRCWLAGCRLAISPMARSWDRKIRQLTLNYRGTVNRSGGFFLNYSQPAPNTVPPHDTPPPLPSEQIHLVSADPGQITSNCLFHCYSATYINKTK